MPIKIMKAAQNGGIWHFKGQGTRVIDFLRKKL